MTNDSLIHALAYPRVFSRFAFICMIRGEPHYTVLKLILRYIHGTIDNGLQLHVSSMTRLTAYTDADWAGYPPLVVLPQAIMVFL